MKKILTVLLVVGCFNGLMAQVMVSAHYLDLKKSKAHHEALAAKEANNGQLVVFASDKNTLTALQYNRALFYKDSISTPRPDAAYEVMAGYSFNADGNPQVYWANHDYSKITALSFNFATKAVATTAMRLPIQEETVLTTFSENNSYYILTLPKEGEKLHLYIFNDGKYQVKTLDFSAFEFYDPENDVTKLNDLLRDYSFQKVESNAFNALPVAGSKIKLYVSPENMVLTLDHHPAVTQVFTIDTAFAIKERLISQATLKQLGKSNSFYANQKLYQLKFNDDEIVMSAKDLATGRLLRSYTAGKEDTLTFTNSPLLIQTGNKPAAEFKSTKKWLSKAAQGSPAITVYQTPDDLMVVAGGLRNVVSTGDAILAVALTGAVVMNGGYGGDGLGLFDSENVQSVYFESLFDDNFQYRPYQQTSLAIDHIGQFIGGNKNISLETVIPYNGYYILGFYDAKAKKYVLLKFEDDYGY
ncbi:hypothetical protein [Flavobacterium subsaxonicum]|nr:hypothetical protein [Flavobacterium subsaxonicum]